MLNYISLTCDVEKNKYQIFIVLIQPDAISKVLISWPKSTLRK
jgi:hypothetical protein